LFLRPVNARNLYVGHFCYISVFQAYNLFVEGSLPPPPPPPPKTLNNHFQKLSPGFQSILLFQHSSRSSNNPLRPRDRKHTIRVRMTTDRKEGEQRRTKVEQRR